MEYKGKHEKHDPYSDYPCRKCDESTRASCCGCPAEKEWREKREDNSTLT